jgi:hypothetical protein
MHLHALQVGLLAPPAGETGAIVFGQVSATTLSLLSKMLFLSLPLLPNTLLAPPAGETGAIVFGQVSAITLSLLSIITTFSCLCYQTLSSNSFR